MNDASIKSPDGSRALPPLTVIIIAVAFLALGAGAGAAARQASDGVPRARVYCGDPGGTECRAYRAVLESMAIRIELVADPAVSSAELAEHGVGALPAVVILRGDEPVGAIAGPDGAQRLERSLASSAISGGPPQRRAMLRTAASLAPLPDTVLFVDVVWARGDVIVEQMEISEGAVPGHPLDTLDSHVVQLLDPDGDVLYARPWKPNLIVAPPPPRPGTQDAPGQPLVRDRVATTLVLPYAPTVAAVRVLDPLGAETLRAGVDRRTLPPLRAVRRARATEIHVTGSDEDRMTVLFLGDRYRGGALREQFTDDVDAHVELFLDTRPISKPRLRNSLNIYRGRKTAGLRCEYNCGGTERLICCDDQRVLKAAAKSKVPVDEIVVLVNDAQYGGSGGVYAVAYNRHEEDGVWGPEVTVHEMGHSAFGLMDEYEYFTNGAAWGPNCSAPPCTWKGGGLGCHDGCSYFGLARPTVNLCLMRTLTPGHGRYEFCKVGQRQVKSVLRQYGRGN